MEGGCKKRMPHALLIPIPAQGHINPMMQLAWKLVSDGFFVTFVNTEFNHQRISQATDSSNNNNCEMIRMIAIPDGLPSEDRRNNIPKLLGALEYSMGPSVIHKLIQDINEEEEEHKVTCIITDVWNCFGLQEVAKFYHVSLAALHTSLACLCAIRYFGNRLVSLGFLNSDGTPKEDKKMIYLPFMPPLYPGELPWLYGGEYMFRKGIRMGEEIRQIKWILFNSFYELEPPVVDEFSKEVGVYPIGPLIPSEFLDGDRISSMAKIVPSLWADDVECLVWLDKQSVQSVIYVSFGSIAVLSDRQMEELALGLEATQRPFLWVLRSDIMNGEKGVLPPGFLERIRDRGCIVSWAPQLRVLAHPSVACFLTHCGWNSVQESITMGVPMICWPFFTDQFINRTYIVHVWKVGLPLNPNRDGIIEKGEFTKVIDMLLAVDQGAEIRNEINKWKGMSRDAVKEGSSSSRNYHSFVNAMREQVIG